ncbi:radical SAM/SPASM domain-containing protein [Spirochaetia bacterium]|nr:radical SAM/SPASM domain-containing protein [Spirochaetia bacterium]
MAYEYLLDMEPLLIQVELTEACNLMCRFCYNSQKPCYNQHIYEMLDTLAGQGIMQLTLTGGEPLMHPEFFTILEKAVKLFPNVMILSNGSLMNDEAVQKISNSNVMSVSISIHGDEATHEHLTKVPGSYSQSMHAIETYLKIGKVPVASNFVLNKYNRSSLEKTAYVFKDMGLQFMTITRFVPVGIGKSAYELEITREDMVNAMEFANRFMSENDKPHIEFAEAVPFYAIPGHLQHLANTCSYGYDRFYVDVNGNMMVCGLTRIPLGGNILEKPIIEIKKNSSVYQAYIHNEHVPQACVYCNLFDNCHGGCRASAMKDGNWKQTYDSMCPKRQGEE